MDWLERIRQDVDLTPSGSAFKGRCPFHRERTPSFFAFPDSQRWVCFGCGAFGDSWPADRSAVQAQTKAAMCCVTCGTHLTGDVPEWATVTVQHHLGTGAPTQHGGVMCGPCLHHAWQWRESGEADVL